MRLNVLGIIFLSLAFSGCNSQNLPYYLSIAPHSDRRVPNITGEPSAEKVDAVECLKADSDCTIYIDKILKPVIEKTRPAPMTPQELQRDFEIAFADELKKYESKSRESVAIPPAGGKKWVSVYSLEASDPDNDLERLEENLRSMRLVKAIAADPKLLTEKPENPTDEPTSSYWCGKLSESMKDNASCPKEERQRLYKLLSCVFDNKSNRCGPIDTSDELEKKLLVEATGTRNNSARDVRFVVVGYEIPWDEEHTRIRYGIIFYFKNTENPVDPATIESLKNFQGMQKTDNSEQPKVMNPSGLLGYTLVYTNEATPEPVLGTTYNADGKALAKDEWWEPWWYPTGRPFALAIGVKNAAFELTKAPFSWVAGALFGRGSVLDYPGQNLKNAWNAISVEVWERPSYGMISGIYNFLTEVPLVGQLFQFNFGPEHLATGIERSSTESTSGSARSQADIPQSKDSQKNDACYEVRQNIRHKIFISRGIYGGDEWAQDTGLWAGWMAKAYADDPSYDIYSPPYEHGTVIDVVWSMFNLSHGPAYSEAKYVMERAGGCDRLYLAGHSGGVQRSTIASRILAHHGYSVDKVLGVAGPSIGQAFVDSRRPHAFRILLNPGFGPNDDPTSKVGMVARIFSSTLDLAVWTAPKYIGGGLAGLKSDTGKQCVYNRLDLVGFSNAEIIEVPRKPSSRHVTPLDLSLREPIVFDAYVRSEMATSFRKDLERSSDACFAMPKLSRDQNEYLDSYGAFPFNR